jgi:hypothetical protein
MHPGMSAMRPIVSRDPLRGHAGRHSPFLRAAPAALRAGVTALGSKRQGFTALVRGLLCAAASFDLPPEVQAFVIHMADRTPGGRRWFR